MKKGCKIALVGGRGGGLLEMDDPDAPWGVHPVRPLYGGDGR